MASLFAVREGRIGSLAAIESGRRFCETSGSRVTGRGSCPGLRHTGSVAAQSASEPSERDIARALAPRVLVVEDDRRLAELLDELLTGQGFAVEIAADGQAGLHAGLTRRYEVLVVDRGLPGIEGVDLITRLRSRGILTPILVLTARGALNDRVEGLDAGAEDYLTKPFEVPELLARLRALLRRHADRAESLPLGRRRLDVAARRVIDDGQLSAPSPDAADVDLTERECGLLAVLASRPNRVFTRAELLERVFDGESPGAVDTYVSYLRRKLGKDAVVTVHGLGYRRGTA
jgi:DNA-binding response OmpR family regulator